MNSTTALSLLLLSASCAIASGGCSQASNAGTATAPSPAAASGEPVVAMGSPTQAAASAGATAAAEEVDYTIPAEPFTDPQRNFDEVKKALLSGYYDPSITEDALYRAAVAGMLERVDPAMRKWNKLMSPAEMSEMHRDLQGEIVGVGVKIAFDPATGYIDVLGSVPGSPAEKAGLAAPDKIVTVDGKLYKGLTLRDAVASIRGKPGDPVTLSVLRGDKLVAVTLKRETVVFDYVSEMVLDDGNIGYARIPSFNAKTPDALAAVLGDLSAKKVHGMVLDLRHCPGGSFDDAIASASELLPSGVTVANVKKRATTEAVATKRAELLSGVPLAVLVDGGTSSGAELVAAALQEQGHATLVGQTTFGKWTVQTVDELPNGYAIKYTLGIFQSPSGKSYQGVGLSPDVEVDMPPSAVEKAQAITDPSKRMDADVQLKTAVSLLNRGT